MPNPPIIQSAIPAEEIVEEVHRCGFAIVGEVLDDGTVDRLLDALAGVGRGEGVRRREQVYAIRNLLEQVSLVRELADSVRVRRVVEPLLGTSAFPVQGLYFDKPPGANWKVPWHQDLSIPVRERIDVASFGPWTVKAGVPHVQPPAELLERVLILRLHLDASTERNGPLRVIPDTHLLGRLSPLQIEAWRNCGEETVCRVPRGGALLMRPLLLHSSSPCEMAGHRRVIHLVYAADRLPGGLAWQSEPERPPADRRHPDGRSLNPD